jgi:Glycosyl hydrolases family 16
MRDPHHAKGKGVTFLPANQREDRFIEGYRLVFDDDFDAPFLDETKWLPFYLPHWSKQERTRPSYEIRDSVLKLYIAEDQQPWCAEIDGNVRVSNLQTGHFSGPLGTKKGQHRFRKDLLVTDEVPASRLFVPKFCRLEMRARAKLGPSNLAALWLIGFEQSPEQAGEITVMEVFGKNVSSTGAVVGRGIKKVNDPELRQEFYETNLPIDLSEWHTYAIDWDKGGVRFYLDSELISQTGQTPDYAMQLMLNFYDLDGAISDHGAADGWFEIDYIRAYERL